MESRWISLLLFFFHCVYAIKPLKVKNEVKLREGGKCDRLDFAHFPVEEHISDFLYCHWWSGTLTKSRCPVVEKIQKVFDRKAQQCLFPDSFLQHAAGSSRVGDTCTFNTDCLTGMYCGNGVCVCLSTYTERDYYCYLKINPSQSGCQYNEQCSASWPQATCTATTTNTGVCNCPANTVAIETRDGYLCTNSLAAACPLPVRLGTNPSADVRLKYGGTATAATCTYGSTQNQAGQTCFSAATNGYSLAEMFECMPDGTQPTVNNAALCCPNRAFTCIQPQVSAAASAANFVATTTRWWYNTVTGTCEQFLWVSPDTANPTRPANSNNFETLAHCQTYCGNTCPRGDPEYTSSTSATTYQSSKPTTCTTTSGCDSNHECTTIGSFQNCCPTYNFVCAQAGGLTVLPTGLNTQYNPGISASPAVTSQRWYYDSTSSRCATFTYNGVAGSFNNFATQSDCQTYCKELLCTRGTPISDASGAYQSCSSNSDCPSTYECNNNVCCPRAQTVCAEPKQIGTCNRNVRRYWYNAVTKGSFANYECEQFYYSGCQGNDNNFDILTECNTYCRNTKPQPNCIQGEAYKDVNGNYYQCSNTGVGNLCPSNYECYYDGFTYGCCPIKTYTCALTSSQGVTCGPSTSRWYYDTTNQVCQTFTYLGCDGNSNNFPNRDLCENYCGVGAQQCDGDLGCPFGGDPLRESDGSVRVCSAGVTCPSTHECQRVTLSSSSQINYCCPSRSYICGLPPAATQTCGRSNTALTRYYHNLASKTCVQFQYYGCSANENNYATLAQCRNFCDSAGCSLGEAVFEDPNTQRPRTCNPSVQNSCPSGYTCRYNSITGTNVCCGATDMGVCPLGEKAFVDPYNRQARECIPNVAGTCPSNFLCRFRSTNSKYYCCLSTTLCPAGKQVYRDPNSEQPQICTLRSVINLCPSGYSCQSAAGTNAFQGYCCTVENICPNNGIFAQDTNKAGIARTCALGGRNPCPVTYQCQASQARNISGISNALGYCCTPGTPNVCGNRSPYLINNQPVSCNASAPIACPQGYTCQTYAITGTSFCCSTASCPANSNPFLERNGDVRRCSPGTATTCPFGYSCVLGANNQYQCCSSSVTTMGDGCPASQVAYLSPGTSQPRSCSLQQANACPIGYLCQWSQSVNRFQCCGTNAGCPLNSVAYINSNSGVAQSCSIGAGICPTGFSCQSGASGQQLCCTTGLLTTPGCNANQVQFNGQCLQMVGPGQPCSVTPQCTGGARCIGNICQATAVAPPTTRNSCPIPGQSVQPGFSNSGISCSPALPNSCSSGYNCQYSPLNSRFICCGSPTSSLGQACPMGSNVAIDPFSNSPRICTGQTASCGSGYQCTYSQVLRQYYCCSSTSIGGSFGNTYRSCSVGTEYMYPGGNSPLQCTYRRDNCPPGNTCSFSSRYNSDVCCSAFKKMKGLKPAGANSTEEHTPFTGTRGSIPTDFGKGNIPNPTVGESTGRSNGINSLNLPLPITSEGQCNPAQSKNLGEECCADSQCPHHCSDYKGKQICMCPRHLLIDMTFPRTRRCVSSCPKWRDGAFCVSSPPYKEGKPLRTDPQTPTGFSGGSHTQIDGHNQQQQIANSQPFS